jgi:hypothetical protein
MTHILWDTFMVWGIIIELGLLALMQTLGEDHA